MTNEPCDMDQIQEQYEDAALTLLVNHIMQKEGVGYLEKNDELRNDPDFEYPADFDKRAAKTIDRHFASLRRHQRLASAGKVFSHVARFFLIAFLIFSITFSTASAFRDATLDILIDVFDIGASISLAGNHPAVPNNMKGPTWFPDKMWTLTTSQKTDSSLIYQYTSEDGDSITYVEMSAAGAIYSIDTEKGEVRTDLSVNGFPALASTNYEEKTINIVWIDTDAGVVRNLITTGASSVFSMDDVIRIAENIS